MDGTLFTMMSICRRGWALPSVHRPQWMYSTCPYTSRQRPQEGTRRPESAPQFPSLPVHGCGWGGHSPSATCGTPHFTRLVWLIPRPEPLDEGSHDSIRPVAPSRAPTLVWLDTFAPGILMLCRFPRNSRINSAPTFQGGMHRHTPQ